MGKIKHKCKNCGVEYENYKVKSDYCCKECREQYNHVPYNCDTCGEEFIAYRGKVIDLQKGKRHGIYCSVECANKSFETYEVKQCLNCGSDYKACQSTKDIQKFCCKDCFEEYREKNARKNIKRICPVCNKEFYSERENPMFCSRECSSKAQQKRTICQCAYCGKEFERIDSEVEKNNNHYCSRECKWMDMQWSKHDMDILKENYNKIKINEIALLLSKPYKYAAIRSQSGRMGLCETRLWSEEDNNKLLKYYSVVPMIKILEMFPNKSKISIQHHAQSLGLKSYQYLKNTYSEEEDNYIKENYLTMTDYELGIKLGRSAYGIEQHLRKIGLHRLVDHYSYNSLSQYVRTRLQGWRNKYRNECNYVCSVSGTHSDIIVHHIRGFNLIMEEAIEDTGIEIKENFEEYAEQELDEFFDYFYNLQEFYGEYCCVNENIHKLFHKIYGYGNNNREQWDEFVEKYHNGEYKLTA